MSLARAECRSSGPVRLLVTASAMARPIGYMLQMNSMRFSASSSNWNMNRKTSHVLTRHTMKTSLVSGISLSNIWLAIRVLMNCVGEASREPPFAPMRAPARASV